MIERQYLSGDRLVEPGPETDTQLTIHTVEPVAGCARLCCTGEIDEATAPLLGAAIRAARPGHRRVEVDLHDVTFLDSSAINTLVRHRADDHELVLVRVPAHIRRLFEITGLVDIFLA
jgi:anti-anti-sigma factor